MSRYVANDAEEKKVKEVFHSEAAIEIGGIEPCREMKGMGWRVILVEKQLYACGIDGGDGFCFATAIEPAELDGYVDEEEAAHKKLTAAL